MRRTERSDPSGAPDERPLAIVERRGAALQVVAADSAAQAQGCAPGAPLAQARAVCPALRVVMAEPHADARLLDAIADWCDRYTPLVALDPPAGLLLDVTGCAHFFGGEAALARDMVERLAAQGFMARAAVADAPGPARALAQFSHGGVAAPGADAELVSRLPIQALAAAPDETLALMRAGLKSVGDVAARGRGEIAARFGAALVRRLDAALGRGETAISPRRPVPTRVVERRFAEPIAHADSVLAALRALAGALAGRLEAAGEGALRVEATFFRTDGMTARIAVGFGAPNRDPDGMLRLLRERLDALADPIDPGFGFDLVRLSAAEVEPLDPRARSFDAREEQAGEFAGLIDRLAARHGRRRVLRFAAGNAHRPEAEAFVQPAQGFASATPWPEPAPGEPPRRPLRMFASPEPVDVLAEVPDGPPVRFVWRRVTHRVARAEGPERIAPEWWRREAAALTRDYFRVEDEEGARFWLYRHGLYVRETERPRWFLHGLFA